MIVALPAANQTFREIVYGVVSARAENDIKPRVFFEDFPNRVLYVARHAAGGGGWRDVFLADTTQPGSADHLHGAAPAGWSSTATKRTVELVLEDGTRHTTNLHGPDEVRGDPLRRVHHSASIRTPCSRRREILKGDNEMTMPELRARAAELRAAGLSPHGPIMALHRKFAIPSRASSSR